MLKVFSRLPVIKGVIDRRILANYRLDPDATAAQLPPPFKPKLYNGHAIGGLCLIRLIKVRPSFLPIQTGIRSENAAHRIAVTWKENGLDREGVYIPRRDTDSRLNALAGGRLFPGVHHHARFEVDEVADRYDVAFHSDDGGCAMRIHSRVADAFPEASTFGNLEAASDFFEAGSLGYSATSESGRFDGLELICQQWSMQPLTVNTLRSSFFDDPHRFPAGTAEFDCALLMRGIDHAWHQRDAMCCKPAQAKGPGGV